MDTHSPLMRPAEVATLLGVSRIRVYQLLRSGEIPSTRVGGAIRVPRGAWDSWLATKTQSAMNSARK